MSRAGARCERAPLDRYCTPPPLARAICDWLSLKVNQPPRRIVEPSAGRGAFIEAARRKWPAANICAVDVDSSCAVDCKKSGANTFLSVSTEDFVRTSKTLTSTPKLDLIVGNPPYTLAQAHIESLLLILANNGTLAFILRINFLAGQDRSKTFWQGRGRGGFRGVVPFAERPSFLNGRTDATEYGLFVWQKSYIGEPQLFPPMFWRTA